jgi:hypothetical protein
MPSRAVAISQAKYHSGLRTASQCRTKHGQDHGHDAEFYQKHGTKMTLNEKMNQHIDQLIAELEQAKLTRTYLQRSAAVQMIAEKCNDYNEYWTERLYSLVD